MTYTLTFRISPAGDFGLPEEDTTVIPGNIGSFHGPSLDTATGQLVGHSTLPIYRIEADRVELALTLPHSTAKISDNNAFLTIHAKDQAEALRLTMADMGKLLRLLSAHRGMFYSAYPLSIVDDELKPYGVPNPIGIGSFRIYSLPTLKSDLKDAAKTSHVMDERLQKAILYMQNALLMLNSFHGKPVPISTTDFNVTSLIVLELSKACTAVMGDPSVKKDRYQKRFRDIGITAEIKASVDKLNRIRNSYDVAHYSLAVDKKQLLENEIPFAVSTAKAVIAAYKAHLISSRNTSREDPGAKQTIV